MPAVRTKLRTTEAAWRGELTLLLSMTGHGEAHRHEQKVAVAVEVRTVNNRYFKLSFRASEGYASLEPYLEPVVREQVRRGTVQVNLRIDREPTADDYRFNDAVLIGYCRHLDRLIEEDKIAPHEVRIESLMMLPGVVTEKTGGWDLVESLWPLVEPVLKEALANLAKMRVEEGRAMQSDLAANLKVVAQELRHVEERAPLVVESYRQRLGERLNKLLSEFGVTVNPTDIIREVGLFAERCDISEEIVRLRSHLDQFDSVMRQEETPGRKLEFITQEMVRETNTIGSKANDAEIARHVIEIKSIIERIREMIQNVE
jgi:uncharacterized protein (TIGR00255 family)